MAFQVINSGEIASGEPTTTTTQNKIKNDLDDHEDRIQALEAVIVDFLPITMEVNGYYYVNDNVLKTTSNSALTITGARILVNVAGSSGTLEIDIKKKRGVGAYTSIFTTKPSLVYSTGDDALSSNAVLDSSQVDIQAGDILRLDITSAQVDGVGFLVRIDYDRGA